ncbi:hypothetical protein GCM10020358_79320 [Amorphoplanes nipponensis]
MAAVRVSARRHQSTTADVSPYGMLPTTPNGRSGGSAAQEVRDPHGDPGQLRQPGRHLRVHLVRDQVRGAPGQFAGERAATGAHLVHQVTGPDAGDRGQPAYLPGIAEEVLPERPAARGCVLVSVVPWPWSCLPPNRRRTRTGVIEARPEEVDAEGPGAAGGL